MAEEIQDTHTTYYSKIDSKYLHGANFRFEKFDKSTENASLSQNGILLKSDRYKMAG
jgi:hypothetical protein